MSCSDVSVSFDSNQRMGGIIWGTLARIHESLQNAVTATYGPYLHLTNVPTVKIVVGLKTFPLHELLLSVYSWTLNKITEYMSIFQWRPQTHVVFEFVCVTGCIGIFFALNPNSSSFTKYLALAACGKLWM